MSGILPLLLSYLLTYKYVAVAAVVFVSAVAIPLPASTVLLAAGAFGSLGFFNVPLTVAVAVCANVAGDVFDFVLARRFREAALSLLPSAENRLVSRIRDSIDRYAAPTIFLTRFVGGVPANLLAGFADVPFPLFFFVALIGDLIQVGSVLYLGYLGGDYWQDLVSVVSLIGWGATVLLIALALAAVFYVRRRMKRSGR